MINSGEFNDGEALSPLLETNPAQGEESAQIFTYLVLIFSLNYIFNDSMHSRRFVVNYHSYSKFSKT